MRLQGRVRDRVAAAAGYRHADRRHRTDRFQAPNDHSLGRQPSAHIQRPPALSIHQGHEGRIGLSNPSIAQIALGVVAPQRGGMASGISNTFRIAGLASGVAALGALFQHRIASSLAAQLGHPVAALTTAVASEGTRAAAGHPRVVIAAQHAFVDGMNGILVVGAVLTPIGAVIGFALVRARDFQPTAAPASTPAAAPSRALEATH